MTKLRISTFLIFWLSSLFLSGQEVLGGHIELEKRQLNVYKATVKFAIRSSLISSIQPSVTINWGDGNTELIPFTSMVSGGLITNICYVGTHTFAPGIGTYTICNSDKFFTSNISNIPNSSTQKLLLQRMIYLDFQNMGITDPSMPWDKNYIFDTVTCQYNNLDASVVSDGWDSTSYSIVTHSDISGYTLPPIGWHANDPASGLITFTANTSGAFNVSVRTNEWRRNSSGNDVLMGWFNRELYISACNVSIPTGIETMDSKIDNFLALFPNPADKVVNVNTNMRGEKQISLLDAIGREVFHTQETLEQFKLNMSDYPQGVYFLQVRTETGLITRKVIKE